MNFKVGDLVSAVSPDGKDHYEARITRIDKGVKGIQLWAKWNMSESGYETYLAEENWPEWQVKKVNQWEEYLEEVW